MVCVDLIGGLGNNLFQIAAAVGYSEKYKVDFQIPEWEYSGCLKIESTKLSNGKVFYGEKGFYYEEIPFIEDVKLFGFFQSEKYFKHCEEKIRELFQFNAGIRAKMNRKYEAMVKEGSNTCSIHIRRGDYIGNNFHEVCNLEYYDDAISAIKKYTFVNLFLVFSDDIPWCKENFKGENYLFVEDNSNIEDLYLMTKCSHNIISNSSFSWWGAWLNSRPNKYVIIITPDRWFNDESRGIKDILPETWIKIKIKQ